MSPTRPLPRVRVIAAAGGTAALLLASAVPATAAETTAPATGTTTIKLSSSVASAMKRGRISLSGVSPARRGATAVKLPLASATIDPEAGGTLNHRGSLRFKRGRRAITLKTFRIAITATQANVNVGIGRSRVRTFDIDPSGVKVAQSRRKLTVSNLKVTLTAIGASRLNRALRVQRFRAGSTFGVATAVVNTPAQTAPAPPAPTGALRGGTSTLTLTPEAQAGIAGGGASITAVAPATGSGGGPFAFPITGGTLDAANRFAGQATLGGALQITSGDQTVTLSSPLVDLANDAITAEVGGSRIEAFSLDRSPLRSVRYDGQLVLDGILVKSARSGPLANPQGGGGVLGFLRIDARTD